MKEKVLSNKKKGMFVLLLTILVYLAVIAGCIVGGFMVGRRETAGASDYLYRMAYDRMGPAVRPEGAETAGGPGPHTVW